MGFSSQAGHVILRTQTVAGTYNSDTGTAGVGIKLRSGALGSSRELLIPDPEIGGGRDVVDALLGAGAFSGDYEFYARMESLGTLLNAAFGSTVDTTDASGASVHTVTPSDVAQLPFLSIEEMIASGLETYHYNDAIVNTFHLESDANGYLMGTAGMIARNQITSNTPTDDTDVLWDNSSMSVGTNITVTYNGVAIPAKSFKFDMNNNFEDSDFRLGSFYLGDLTPKRREITASFTVRPNDHALLRQATYGVSSATAMGGLTTKQQLVITMQTYEMVPGSTGPAEPYQLSITIPKFVLKPFSLSPSGDDIIENDVEGQALRIDPASPICTLVLRNSTDVSA